MARVMAGKRWLLLLLMVVSTALVAARSARRRDARPRPFPPAVPRSPLVPAAATPTNAAARTETPGPADGAAPLAPVDDVADLAPVDDVAAPAPSEVAAPSDVAAPGARPTASPGALAALEPDTPTPSEATTPDAAAAPTPGPFPGSVLPLPDGSAPSAEYVIKGNANSMRCHGPSSPYYGRTRAEVWFRTEQDAIAAGFRPWAPKGQ